MPQCNAWPSLHLHRQEIDAGGGPETESELKGLVSIYSLMISYAS